MDAAWVQVLAGGIGALAALGGTLVANHFSLRRDREQWERQRQAELEKSARERQEQARGELREIYSNCLRSLAEFRQIEARDSTSLSEEEYKQYYADIGVCYVRVKEALWLLSLNLEESEGERAAELRRLVGEVLDSSSAWVPEKLYEQVTQLALSDRRLSVPALHTPNATALPLAVNQTHDRKRLK